MLVGWFREFWGLGRLFLFAVSPSAVEWRTSARPPRGVALVSFVSASLPCGGDSSSSSTAGFPEGSTILIDDDESNVDTACRNGGARSAVGCIKSSMFVPRYEKKSSGRSSLK